MITKPICCEYEMKVVQVGVPVVELMGTEPYQLWMADELQCRVCDRRVLYGFADRPIAHHGDEKMAQAMQDRNCRYVQDHTASPEAFANDEPR